MAADKQNLQDARASPARLQARDLDDHAVAADQPLRRRRDL